jgi:hypothetical protein
MIQTTTFHSNDLRSGSCKSCGEYSDEIVKGDGRCVDCVFDQQFFDSTMKDEEDDDFDEEE